MATTMTFSSVGQKICTAINAEEKGDSSSVCYGQYITCLRDIFVLLDTEASASIKANGWPLETGMENRHRKLLNLAKECIDRASNQFQPNTVAPRPQPPPPTQTQSLPPAPQPQPLPPTEPKQVNPTAIESPMDIATRENRKLINTFQRRIRSGRFNAQQLTNLNLSLQRKLAENLAIAREKQETFGQWFNSAIEEQQRSIETVYQRYPRIFASHILQGLYRGSSQFEFHFLTKDNWYQRCKSGRDSVKMCLTYVLKIPHHPLSEYLRDYLGERCQILKTLTDGSAPSRNSYNSTECNSEPVSLTCDSLSADTASITSTSSQDVYQFGLDLIQHLWSIAQVLSLVFSEEKTLNHSETIFEVLNKVIFEGKFYSLIFDYLTVMYKDYMDTFEQAMDLNLEELMMKSAIKLKYAFMNDPSAYESAIQDFARLVEIHSPVEKLSALCNAMTSLVQYVHNRLCLIQRGEEGVGADELLPILCYVMLRSHLPRLFLECKFLENFVIEDRLAGAEGYTLTTFITALTYCSISPLQSS